jgi:hypothetical protein
VPAVEAQHVAMADHADWAVRGSSARTSGSNWATGLIAVEPLEVVVHRVDFVSAPARTQTGPAVHTGAA